MILKRIKYLFIVCILFSCSQNENKETGTTSIEKNYKIYLENFFSELSTKETWEDTKSVFFEYYYKPDSLMEGELIEYFLMDFETIWIDVNGKKPPYLGKIYHVLQDQDLMDSAYELTLKYNKTCDECIVLQPYYNKKAVLYFCFKYGKIFSTIGSVDLENEEYVWYRYKKKPPMRFK